MSRSGNATGRRSGGSHAHSERKEESLLDPRSGTRSSSIPLYKLGTDAVRNTVTRHFKLQAASIADPQRATVRMLLQRHLIRHDSTAETDMFTLWCEIHI